MPSFNLANVEIGLRRALKASFLAKGMGEAEAFTKVEQKLAAAKEKFQSQLTEHQGHGIMAAKYAMHDVIAWANTLR